MSTLIQRITDLATAIRDKFNLVTPRLVPAGGATGQALAKSGSADYAVSWQSFLPSGGGTITGNLNVTGTLSQAGTSVLLASSVGAANGLAPLDSGGKVAAAYLPSYVDDVLEYANLAGFPGTGEAGKIYVADDTNKTYRWTGTQYVEISASPGSTDAVAEGATNKYFTNARAIAALAGSTIAGALTVSGTVTAQGATNLNGQVIVGTNALASGIALYVNAAAGQTRTLGFLTAGAYAADIALQSDNGTLKHNVTTAHRFDVSGSQKLIIQAGNSTSNQDFIIDRGGANGALYFGPTANGRYLYYDGSNYSIGAGANTNLTHNGYLTVSGFDSTYNVGVKQNRSGQVGYHMYNGGATAEWLMYQPAPASGHDFRICTFVGGTTTDRFKITPDGTTYVTSGSFSAQGEIWSVGQIIRFGGAGANHYVWFDNANYQMPNGGLIVGGNITSSSDRRLKSDIRRLEGARDIVGALNGYRFTMYGAPSLGVIAQEVEEVLPELVLEDHEGIKSVDYGKLSAVLIEDNNALAARVATLEALVEKLLAA